MEMQVSVEGAEAIVEAMGKVSKEIEQKINEAIQGAGIDIEAMAKKACPVGTPESTGKKGYIGGRLRSSIKYTPGYLSCTVWTNVEYAPFVELGHRTRSGSHVPAKPFLYPAFEAAAHTLEEELRNL